MDSLGRVYRDALERQYDLPQGWVANWPAGSDYVLGQVGTIDDDGHFAVGATLSDVGVAASQDPEPGMTDGPEQFQSSNDIEFAIETDASLPAWKFIGNAKAGLRVGFEKHAGVLVAVGSARRQRLANIDGLKRKLISAAEQRKLHAGQAVIVEMQVAESGLVITSAGGSGELEATTSFDVGPTGTPKLLNFAADLDVKRQSAAMDHATYPNGFITAFRVVKLGRRGWWFWRRFTVSGVRAGGLDDPEALLEERDYFAPFPDAEFSETVTLEP
jgi:hypothetical protein